MRTKITPMRKITLFALLAVLVLTSCNRYVKSGMGGSTDVTLTRNSDEYTIKRLKKIEMSGKAIFGIPGFGQNNQNKNKAGMVFKFNGIEIGRTPRIAPILTMAALTIGYTSLTQSVIKNNKVKMYWPGAGSGTGYTNKKNLFFNNDPMTENFGRLRFPFALIVGAPLAGATNNFIWSGTAASGLTNQMYYRLVDENPDVDIFTNPKYKIDYKLKLFTQHANISADVMGATLKLNK